MRGARFDVWVRPRYAALANIVEVDLRQSTSVASGAKGKKASYMAQARFGLRAVGFVTAVMLVMSAGVVEAQEPSAGGGNASGGQSNANAAAPTGAAAKIAVELNKLETQQSSCRAYLVIDNQSEKSYDVLKLDLVLFQNDGIIGRRFALDLAPIKGKKRSVKLFDLDGVKCETIGSFLINDIMECKSGGTDESACLDRLALSTRSNVQLSK